MFKKKLKTGLALGSGSARGLSHLGVLEVLLKENIPIDFVAGTSVGALIGALYAMGKSTDEIYQIVKSLGAKRMSLLADPGLPRTGLVRGRRIKEALKVIYRETRFSDLKMPFVCVATDLDTGEDVIIDRGPIVDAVLASSSIPIIFAAVKRDNRYLVDGALVKPVPVDVLRRMGAEFVIAVNVSPNMVRAVKSIGQEPNIFKVIAHVLHTATYQAIKSCLSSADVIIEPDIGHIGAFDFHRVDECVELGRAAAQVAIPVIRKRLKLKD